MRKFLILLVVFTSIGASAFSQLRVINKSGRDVYVSVDSKEIFIPNKEVKIFSNTRSIRTVWLDCKLSDGTKFTVSKDVSRSGSVELLPNDNSTSPGIVKEPVVVSQPITVNQLTGGSVDYTASIYNNPSTRYSDSINDLSGSKTSYEDVDAINNSVVIASEETSNSETSLSSILRGSNVKESPISTSTQMSTPTPISVQTVVRSVTSVTSVTSTETRKIKFRVEAKDYKILIEPDSGEIISLGYKGVSRSIDLPIGQSYIKIAYTDPEGFFHPTTLMLVHVTSQDKYILINVNNLTKTVNR